MTQEVTVGTRGPIPSRDDQRRRRNKPDTPTTKSTETGNVKIPRLPPNVHLIARQWWQSLKDSGQSKFFEPSDWAAAMLVVHDMDRHLRNHRPSSEWFKGIWSAMNDLLTTEAARRRVRMEITRADAGASGSDEDDDIADVVSLDRYRSL